MRALPLVLFSLLSILGTTPAQGGETPPAPKETAPKETAKDAPQDPNAPKAPKEHSLASVFAKYEPKSGTVTLGKWAEVKLAPGWLWLDGEHGRRWLRELGNQPGPSILGVAIPPDFIDAETFAVYSYEDDGHIADDESPDYDELLADMQASTKEQSKARQKAGLGTVELHGWAEPPHYDKAQRKLYWAEKLQFGDSDGMTLNYNVRILGRSGHLVVNGVGGIEQLPLVAEQNKNLLQWTEFVAGQRYEDFDPSYDKVAAYGIGGLIAGKLALKVGLFAKLALLLKAFIKPILVGVVLIGGFLWKVVTGRKAAAKEAGGA
jgi:uncharacterized membrane-anchored protein